MKIVDIALIHSRNIHSERPVVRVHLDVSRRESDTSRAEEVGVQLSAFLTKALGAVKEDYARSDLGSLVAWGATELQRSIGAELGTIPPIPGEHDGGNTALYETEHPRVGVLAGRTAFRVTRRLLRSTGKSRTSADLEELETLVTKFGDRASVLSLPAQDREVLRVANTRGIEILRLGHRLFQLGQGRFRERVYGSSTSRLSNLSTKIAANKDYTKRLLRDLGLPVARFARVRGPERAIAAAEKIGYPVVIKPNASNLGHGVSIGVRNAQEVPDACRIAQRYGKSILVEELVNGQDHRLLVIGGKFIAGSRRVPAHVVGDGRNTVRELAAIANKDPRRVSKQRGAWTALVIDDMAERVLERQGMTADSVPPEGKAVYLRAVANTSSGGTAVDITDEIHPDILRVAEHATVAMGMDLAGVDILATDLKRPLHETGGVICEINTKPGLRKHMWPAVGKPRNVVGPLLDMLFPGREYERFRTVTIVAPEDGAFVVQMVSDVLERLGHKIATSSPDRPAPIGAAKSDDREDPVAAARRAFLDPYADGAVLLTTPHDLITRGLGYSSCSVGVLMGPLQPPEGAPTESWIRALRVVPDAARLALVVDADDPEALRAAGKTDRPTCYVLTDPVPTSLRPYLAQKASRLVTSNSRARANAARGSAGEVTIHQNNRKVVLTSRELTSIAPDGEVSPRQAAFATAILLSLGVSAKEIKEALGPAPVRRASAGPWA